MASRLPFGGFYESMWSSELDRCEEQECERLSEEHDIPEGDIRDILFKHSRYHEACKKIASEYSEYFGHLLEIECKFDGMESPKYYNFETDRIFAKIGIDDLYKIYRKVGKKRMRQAAREMFTSRDGFISHYSWDLDDWGYLNKWDHNQDYCLLHAYLDMEYGDGNDWEWGLIEDMQEVIYSAYQDCVDWNAVHFDIGKITGGIEREEELLEPEYSERKFPRKWKDAADYIQQFIEGNGYVQTDVSHGC